MNLKIAAASEATLWDEIVNKSPQGSIFHTWKFLQIIEKYSKTKFYPIIGLNGTNPIGIFPLFLKKKPIRMVFSPPPHVALNYLGPVFSDYDKLKQSTRESVFIDFQKSVDNFIQSELRPKYSYFVNSPSLLDSRPFKWSNYKVTPMYSYKLDLSPGLDKVWENFKKSLRQGINKGKKEGVTVEEGTRKDVEILYSLMNKRYEEQDKIVTVPKKFLLELFDSFSPTQNFKIYIAKYKGDIISGVIDLHFKDKITTWIGNPKTDFEGFSPNDVLFWESLQNGYNQGLRNYELIGAAGSKRLYSYYFRYNPDLSVNFSAVKFNSFEAKIAESMYQKILKPSYSKLKIFTKR